MPFQNIVRASCEETEHVSKSMQIFEMFKNSADLFDILPEPLKTCDYADYKMNSLAIHFVKEEKEEGILKLKKVIFIKIFNKIPLISLGDSPPFWI